MEDYKIKNMMLDLVSFDDHINYQKNIYYYDFINEIEALREKFGGSPKEQMELQALESQIFYRRIDDDL